MTKHDQDGPKPKKQKTKNSISSPYETPDQPLWAASINHIDMGEKSSGTLWTCPCSSGGGCCPSMMLTRWLPPRNFPTSGTQQKSPSRAHANCNWNIMSKMGLGWRWRAQIWSIWIENYLIKRFKTLPGPGEAIFDQK